MKILCPKCKERYMQTASEVCYKCNHTKLEMIRHKSPYKTKGSASKILGWDGIKR